MRVAVFCRVVDNYGDAGVAWRLARQLAGEHAADVTLHIDARAVLARIVPELDGGAAPPAAGGVADAQPPGPADARHHARDPAAVPDDAVRIEGVRVRGYDAPPAQVLPDVVIEAFGGGLPQAWLERMAASARPPLWFNLEYLSAEPWIESAHALPSPQPRLPLTRWFWFPGFTPRTGGLLRERDLLARRDTIRRLPRRQRLAAPVAAAVDGVEVEGFLVSLFCYPNPALPALLDAWAEGDERITCLVPHGVAAASFDLWLGGAVPHDGGTLARGALTVVGIPFTSQDDYDRLLWTCDLNMVRGEDSFVRAQWAAAPFAWHAYPQADDAHAAKIDAFLTRYLDDLALPAAAAVRRFWVAWNAGNGADAAAAWPAFRAALPAVTAHGARWAAALAQQQDLAGKLLEFCRERL